MTTFLHSGTGSFFYFDDFGIYSLGLVSVAFGSLNTMQFDNTALYGLLQAGGGKLDLGIDAGTSAVNYGRMAASTWQGTTTMQLDANAGAFGNAGTIDAALNGAIDISFGSGATSYLWNTGLIQASADGELSLVGQQLGMYAYSSAILNMGTIDADGGSIDIRSNIIQNNSGLIRVENGGALTLAGATDGGTVEITSGSLYFRQIGVSGAGAPSAGHFASNLLLDGKTASIGFGASSAITDIFDEATQNLSVFSQYGQHTAYIAEIHVTGPSAYFASDFTTSGKTIFFTAH